MTKNNGDRRGPVGERLTMANDSQTVSHLQRALNKPADNSSLLKHLTTAHLAAALGSSSEAAPPPTEPKPTPPQTTETGKKSGQ
jgi:hypothetical protein